MKNIGHDRGNTTSNTQHQKTWYKKNIEKCAEYSKHHYPTSKYHESNKSLSKKYYQSKKDVKFPTLPPSTKLCQNIVSDFCADASPEETVCAVCGKLTPICKMEELSEVENINCSKWMESQKKPDVKAQSSQ